MAFLFTDGFDCYATPADMILGYWDGSGTGLASSSLVAGRFPGSRAIQWSNVTVVTKTSSQNDQVHHLCVAFQTTSTLTGSTLGFFVTLNDGSTAQCSVVIDTSGNMLLKSGAVGGATLATYSGAVTAANTWHHFEVEINISNTGGFMNVRKNGNTVNDFSSATNLNTRAGTSNSYANQIKTGTSSAATQQTDDFIWQSGAVAGNWIGETRCRTRMPAADSGTPQWTRSGVGSGLTQTATQSTTTAVGTTTARISAPLTVVYAGTIASISVAISGTPPSNIKGCIYADNGSNAPGAILAQSAGQSCISGTNVLAMTVPPTVTPGQKIYFAAQVDTLTGFWGVQSGTTGFSTSVSYAAFPQANPVIASGVAGISGTITFNAATGNYQMVQEAQQDGTATYNYDSTSGDTDRFTISAIDTTPATIFCTTVRALLQKSDAGSRNTKVLLKSGSTEVDTGSQANNAGVWGWQYRTDTTDPATSAAWTATAVNNALIGVQVV